MSIMGDMKLDVIPAIFMCWPYSVCIKEAFAVLVMATLVD